MELLSRLLPVSSPPYILPVSSSDPVAHFQQNLDFTYSSDWKFSIRVKKHSNNFGYLNKQNYYPDERTPLLMVVGDSYVEALQVDSGKSSAELLNSRVSPKGRVYSIGLSGAPLSQYLVFAEYSNTTFHPTAMAFVIIGNDFDESFAKYKQSSIPRFHYFKETESELEIYRVDYRISNLKNVLRKSSFIRYIMLNIKGKHTIENLFSKRSKKSQQFIGNVPRQVDKQRIIDSKRSIDEFLSLLPFKSGLDPHSILFVLDGMRPELYSAEALNEAEDSYFVKMRRYFQRQAKSHGYEVIDMQPVFIKNYALTHSRFEFVNDGHWNEEGHMLVANAIQKSGVFVLSFN